VTIPLADALKSSNAEFIKDPKFGWRFKFLDEKGLVTTVNLQRELYLKGTGLKGTWTPETKDHVKTWAAGIANIWHDPRTREIQFKFIKDLLPNYTTPTVKKELFDPNLKGIWVEVAQAAYTSFAANLPAEAAKQFMKHKAETKYELWTREWVLAMIRQLTFGPKITIYPQRYAAIRPTIEKYWGVELPKTPKDLQEFDKPVPEQSSPEVPQIQIVIDQEDMRPGNDAEPTAIVPIPSPPNDMWKILEKVVRFILELLLRFKSS
jgi:hypothetical protein